MIEKIYTKYGKVLLDNLGDGRGEVTVIGDMRTYSHFWGSMGESLNDFLLGVNPDYFATKLIHYNDMDVFDAKESVKSVRRFIREEIKYELPWYEYPKQQKELREKLKEFEECYSEEDFVNRMHSLPDDLYYYDSDFREDEKFNDILRDTICCEPWHFIVKGPTREYKTLLKLLPELQKKLKKLADVKN